MGRHIEDSDAVVRIENSKDIEKDEVVADLREIADEIESGGIIHTVENSFTAESDDITLYSYNISYTPTAE